VLEAKAAEHGIPLHLLREVYCRGLAAHAAVPAHLLPPPPAGPEEWAQARVNAFVRMVSGDPAAIAAGEQDADVAARMPRREDGAKWGS
jgi:hypothetical protein